MSDLHLDSSFYKQSMDIDKYFKIKKWHDSSIGQSTVTQRLDKKRPKLSNLNQKQNRRRYVNFENGSHLICSFNLNNPEKTVCIAFRMNGIASGDSLYLNSIIGNNNGNKAKYITFYKAKWHVISVTWSNRRNISNCWSNGEKLMTFNTGNAKGYDHCFIGDIGTTYGTMSGRSHLIGCIGEIIGFYRSLTDEETSHIHQYLMKKWGI